MRVHTKVVIRMADGAVLHEEGYDYDGPTAECKGTVNVPGPTASEQALQSEQVNILRQQKDIVERMVRESQLLAPFLYQSQGLTPQIDPQTGEVTGVTQDPRFAEIQSGLLERQRAALSGDLPVAPGLLRDLAQQEETLRERLRRQLGPGAEISSPGIEALARFQEGRNAVLQGAREGQLTLAEQLGLANQQAQMQALMGLGGRQAGPFAGFGQTAAGFQGPLGNLFNQRQLEFQANQLNARAALQGAAGIGRGIGTIAGGTLGAIFGGPFGALAGASIGGGAGGGLGTSVF